MEQTLESYDRTTRRRFGLGLAAGIGATLISAGILTNWYFTTPIHEMRAQQDAIADTPEMKNIEYARSARDGLRIISGAQPVKMRYVNLNL